MPELTPEQLQAKANAEASENYKNAVGQKFTDGKKIAEVRQYIPSRLDSTGPRQCFLVNYGHLNVSFFVPCKEFMENFKPVTDDSPVAAKPETNLPQ